MKAAKGRHEMKTIGSLTKVATAFAAACLACAMAAAPAPAADIAAETVPLPSTGKKLAGSVDANGALACYQVTVPKYVDVTVKLKTPVLAAGDADEYTGVMYSWAEGADSTPGEWKTVDVCPSSVTHTFLATGAKHSAYLWVKGASWMPQANSYTVKATRSVRNCVRISKLTSPKKGCLSVKWAKNKMPADDPETGVCSPLASSADTYKITYGRAKDRFSRKNLTTVKVKKASGKIALKGLKSGKKYFVEIRTVRTYAGKKLTSTASNYSGAGSLPIPRCVVK